MGKTPKKAAPGGDERNLYNRRLKATTAPSNPSETSLHKRQRESEISNRSKLSTLKKLPPITSKNIRSQLRGPAKFRSKKRIGKAPSTSSIETKIPPASKGEQSTSAAMQPESEETELKVMNATAQKENSTNDTVKESTKSENEHVDRAASEPISLPKVQEDSTEKEIVIEKEQPDCSENANEVEKEKEVEQPQESDLNLRLETEDPVAKPKEQTTDESKEEETEKCPPVVVAPLKNGVHEKEDLQSESQTDTESNSIDVHELTTSEVSEVSESTSQTDVQKEPEKSEESNNSKDVSFVSYDSSIMLKDVQIKLNDCLKEKSKLLDSRSVAHSTPSQPPKDMSYGKTLRSISGRRSLSRMRHVTVREHRYSPNDSMFVNTSTASFPPDETADFKILRYSTGLSDTLSTNGSPTERKRKTENEDWNSMKKQKTESENSLLNSSISLLKGLRRPIQVSTPVSELKFQTGKLEMDEESKTANEGSKKWCVIM